MSSKDRHNKTRCCMGKHVFLFGTRHLYEKHDKRNTSSCLTWDEIHRYVIGDIYCDFSV